MKKADMKKEIIVNVSQAIFARYGLGKTTVDEIAAAARMGKASLYHYFDSKEDIFKAVVEKEGRILKEKIQQAINNEKMPQQKIKVHLATRLKYLSEMANIHSALKDDNLDQYPFIKEIRENAFHEEMGIIKSILVDGVKAGIFKIRDIELTSFALMSALKGIEHQWSVKVLPVEMDKNIDKLMELLFEGIVKR